MMMMMVWSVVCWLMLSAAVVAVAALAVLWRVSMRMRDAQQSQTSKRGQGLPGLATTGWLPTPIANNNASDGDDDGQHLQPEAGADDACSRTLSARTAAGLARELAHALASEPAYMPPAVRPPRVHDAIESLLKLVCEQYVASWFVPLIRRNVQHGGGDRGAHEAGRRSRSAAAQSTGTAAQHGSGERHNEQQDRQWQGQQGEEQEPAFQRHLMVLLLELVDALHERAITHMDGVDFYTRQLPELLEMHLTEFRHGSPSSFRVHPASTSSQRLQRYLHGYALAIVHHALPSRFGDQPTLRQLAADILATSVLTPLVVYLSDPHFINGCIVSYFQQQEQHEAGQAGRGNAGTSAKKDAIYTYANTYTGFTRMIKKSSDVDELLHVRANLIAEITKAAVIRDLKAMKRMSAVGQGDEGALSLYRDAAQMAHFQTRNVKRYINECIYAKLLCERQLRQLGGPSYFDTADTDPLTPTGSGEAGPTFEETLDNGLLLGYFLQFLSLYHKELNFKFYQAVRQLRLHISRHHTVVPADLAVIHAAFDLTTRGVTALQIDPDTRKQLQQLLRRFSAQYKNALETQEQNLLQEQRLLLHTLMRAFHQVAALLREEHHHFVCSDIYRDYVHHANQQSATLHRKRQQQQGVRGPSAAKGGDRALSSVPSSPLRPSSLHPRKSRFTLWFGRRDIGHCVDDSAGGGGVRGETGGRTPGSRSRDSEKHNHVYQLDDDDDDDDDDDEGAGAGAGVSGRQQDYGAGDGRARVLPALPQTESAAVQQLLEERRASVQAVIGEMLLRQLEGLDTTQETWTLARLRSEITALERHREETAHYWSAVGRWRAEVQTLDEADDGELLCLVAVHHEGPQSMEEATDDAAHGQLQSRSGQAGQAGQEDGSGSATTARDREADAEDAVATGGVGGGGEAGHAHVSAAAVERARSGWILCRRLREFEYLHARLRDLDQSAVKRRYLRLPPVPWIRSSRRVARWRARTVHRLQALLDTCLRHERFSDSQALFTFLSPSPSFVRRLYGAGRAEAATTTAATATARAPHRQVVPAGMLSASSARTRKPEQRQRGAGGGDGGGVGHTGSKEEDVKQKRDEGEERGAETAQQRSDNGVTGERRLREPVYAGDDEVGEEEHRGQEEDEEPGAPATRGESGGMTPPQPDETTGGMQGAQPTPAEGQRQHQAPRGVRGPRRRQISESVGFARAVPSGGDNHGGGGDDDEHGQSAALHAAVAAEGGLDGPVNIEGQSGEGSSGSGERETAGDAGGHTGPSEDMRKAESKAEPIFRLISEVFELKGVFTWLRRQLVAFVRLAYGANINRQLQAAVAWLSHEPQMLWFVHLLRTGLFPDVAVAESADVLGSTDTAASAESVATAAATAAAAAARSASATGHTASASASASASVSASPASGAGVAASDTEEGGRSGDGSSGRTAESSSYAPPTLAERDALAAEACQLLLRNLSPSVKVLVGPTNARKGALKLLHVLQHHRLNQHLVLCFLELLLVQLFPELPRRPSLPDSFVSVPFERERVPTPTPASAATPT